MVASLPAHSAPRTAQSPDELPDSSPSRRHPRSVLCAVCCALCAALLRRDRFGDEPDERAEEEARGRGIIGPGHAAAPGRPFEPAFAAGDDEGGLLAGHQSLVLVEDGVAVLPGEHPDRLRPETVA